MRHLSAMFAALSLCMVAAASVTQPADQVIINALIWTADPERPAATALAMRNGKIVALGSQDDVDQFIGGQTRVINVEGRRVVPGLIDTHIHLAGAADDFQHLYLRQAQSREHLLDMIREHARELDVDDWVIGVRWTAESWPDQRVPTADEIDEAAGGRRAVLIRMDGHMLLASRPALEYADITATGPPDPPGGRIGRAPDGTPTGEVFEQAMTLIRSRVPPTGRDDLLPRFQRAIEEAHRVGLTQVGAIEARDVIENILVPLDEQGRLHLRIVATVRATSDRGSHWDQMLEWAAANPTPSENVRVIGFKGFMDGTLGSRTAWMREPYLDNPPHERDNRGFPLALAGSGRLAELIQQGASMSLQPAVHAIGEEANHVLLNWYEALSADQRQALRPRIEHAQHLLAKDVERFASLGVVASMQPLHKADDGRYAADRLGDARLRYSYAYRSLVDSGAIVAFGSDWPVVSHNPFLGIYAAASSLTLDGKTFLPEQSISVEEALVAYTRAAAMCLQQEHQTGMLRVGYAADLIVLDRDILAEPIETIPETQVLLTMVGGRIVHRAAPFD